MNLGKSVLKLGIKKKSILIHTTLHQLAAADYVLKKCSKTL